MKLNPYRKPIFLGRREGVVQLVKPTGMGKKGKFGNVRNVAEVVTVRVESPGIIVLERIEKNGIEVELNVLVSLNRRSSVRENRVNQRRGVRAGRKLFPLQNFGILTHDAGEQNNGMVGKRSPVINSGYHGFRGGKSEILETWIK